MLMHIWHRDWSNKVYDCQISINDDDDDDDDEDDDSFLDNDMIIAILKLHV